MRIQSTLASLLGIGQPVLLFVWMATAAPAQLPQPKLDWIFPPGGQRGKQVEITIGGADLDEGREIVFSHAQLTARPKRTPSDEFYPEGQPVLNQFSVEVGADVPPGFYDAQLVGRHGVSTVREFQVSDFSELAKTGNNHTIEQAQPLGLGQLVNGRTETDQVDYYAVDLVGGEQLACEVWARRIDSLAEMQVEICRADGAPLKSHCRWDRRDPVLSFTTPAAGKYFLRAHDVTFRGGEPFFYRLALHQRPAVSILLPPVPLLNPVGDVTWFGRMIAATSKAPDQSGLDPLDAEPRELDADRFATSPPASLRATNDAHPSLPRLGVPGEFIGQFRSDRHAEWIELQPDAAGEAVIEVFSQRLGQPTDPFLTISRVVKNQQGEESLEQVAEADRGEDRPDTPGFNTTTEDPYLRLKLEKGTVYRIMVRDQNSFSGSDESHSYRLLVRRPQPDFRLLVSPVSPWSADPKIPLRWPLNVGARDALAIPVVAVRQDGFAGDIVVTAEGLPAGVNCEPVTIRTGKTSAQLVLTTDQQVAEWVGSIRMVGEGQVGETRVRRVATPASLVWDTTVANFDRARLNRQLVIAVIKDPAPVSVRFDQAKWETAAGGVVKAKVAVSARAELKEALNLAPVGLPDGVTAKVVIAEDKKSADLELTVSEKTAPGTYDISVTAKPLIVYQNNPEAAARASEDQARIAKLVAGFKSKRDQLVAAAGATADAKSPEIKQLDEQLARGDAALKAATDRASKLAAAAKPAERRSYVVSNVGALRVLEKTK
jgi:hypothetical protein